MNQWQKDSQIDELNLDNASRDTPKLHAKYLALHSTAKLMLRKAENRQKKLLKDKWLYYNGKMDQSDMESRGWEPDPFDGLKILKTDMAYYYDTDPELQESEDRIVYLKTVLDTLKEIIDVLRWRHQHIGNMIKWRQFQAGG